MNRRFFTIPTLLTTVVFAAFLLFSIEKATAQNYCPSSSAFPWEDWVARVQIGELDKTSGKSPFSDFTAAAANLSKNAPVPFTLTTGFSYFTHDEYWTVWIDLNHDNVFSSPDEIVTKQILAKPADGTPTAAKSGTFNIPIYATDGPTRMRVSMKRGGFSTACETLSFGEVEDYTVNIGGGATPDLTTTAWEIIPANQNCYTNPGQALTFFAGLAINLGPVAVGAFNAKVYLSSDNSLSANDLLWQTFNYTGLSQYPLPGTTASLNITAPVPAVATPGKYFAIVKVDADNQIAESDESNNIFLAELQIGPGGNCGGTNCQSKGNFPWEDWVSRVKMVDVDNSSGKSQYSDFTGKTVNVNAGSPTSITLGAGFSYFTFDEYWKVWIDYNQNGIFEEADETFVSLTVPRPAEGTPFYDANTSAFVKGGFAQDFTTRMRVAMKRGSYPTPCEMFAFGEVEDYSIHIAPGGGQSRPDLSLLNLLAASSGAQGAVVPFTFDLKNSGTANATGNFTIGAYLSTDGQLDTGDVLVGSVATGNTPVGTTIPNVQGAITVPASLPVGNYFLILKADIDNTIAELDELNNSTSRPFSVTPGSGGGGSDLELTLTANKTAVPIYSNVGYILKAKNNGNQPIQSAKIAIGVCQLGGSLGFSNGTGLVYPGTPQQPTLGSFDLVAQEWALANLAPGQTAQLNIALFTLTAAERKVIAFSAQQSPADPDSQPGGKPANCTPAQDDEAVWTINAGQSIFLPGDDREEGLSEVMQPSAKSASIFPNPAGESVVLDLSSFLETENVEVTFFDNKGLALKALRFDKVESAFEEISLEGFQNGLYFVRFTTQNRRPETVKLAVQRTF